MYTNCTVKTTLYFFDLIRLGKQGSLKKEGKIKMEKIAGSGIHRNWRFFENYDSCKDSRYDFAR